MRRLEYALIANPVQDCPGPLSSGVDRVEDSRVDMAVDRGWRGNLAKAGGPAPPPAGKRSCDEAGNDAPIPHTQPLVCGIGASLPSSLGVVGGGAGRKVQTGDG